MLSILTFMATISAAVTLAAPLINATSLYPYTAALFQPALIPRSSTSFICSGVLVSSQAVLTLAECVSGLSATDLSIRTGTSASTFKDASATAITTHPSYDMDTLANDIAIVHLACNVTGIVPVEIEAANSTTASAIGAGDEDVTLVSWGSESNVTQTIARVPKIINVRTLSDKECATRLAPCYHLDPTQHFCTKVKQEGQAYGDGGGAVIKAGNLVGLISGNPSCANEETVSLQVSIEDFKGWIEGVL